MGVLVRSRRGAGADATSSGASSSGAAADAGPPKGARTLKPCFTYETAFDTRVLGERLYALTQLDLRRSLLAILFDWGVIAATIAGALTLERVSPGAFLAAYPLAVLVVGARMHGLLVLMHDASHFRFSANAAWNDLLANWLCAYPGFVAVEGYRQEHARHHVFVNSDKDPNWISKAEDPEWEFPRSRASLAWIFAKELAGFGLWRMIRYVQGYRRSAAKENRKNARGKARVLPRLAFYGLLALALTLVGGWREFLLFWIVPFVTVLPAILRLRIISEHHGLERKGDLTHSRNYLATPLERFLFAPHNVHLHLVHHLFASIPFFNLPRAQELLLEIPAYRDGQHLSETILGRPPTSVLSEVTVRG